MHQPKIAVGVSVRSQPLREGHPVELDVGLLASRVDPLRLVADGRCFLAPGKSRVSMQENVTFGFLREEVERRLSVRVDANSEVEEAQVGRASVSPRTESTK